MNWINWISLTGFFPSLTLLLMFSSMDEIYIWLKWWRLLRFFSVQSNSILSNDAYFTQVNKQARVMNYLVIFVFFSSIRICWMIWMSKISGFDHASMYIGFDLISFHLKSFFLNNRTRKIQGELNQAIWWWLWWRWWWASSSEFSWPMIFRFFFLHSSL